MKGEIPLEGVKNPPHERRRVLEDRLVARRSVRPTGLQGTLLPCGTQDGRHPEACIEDSGESVHSKYLIRYNDSIRRQLYQRMRTSRICQLFSRSFYVAASTTLPPRRRFTGSSRTTGG
jgi:hypothetical protein